jgi:hypothetical protein
MSEPWEPYRVSVGSVTGSADQTSLRMRYVIEIQLDTLSVKELRELKENIETAARAAIRERNQSKYSPRDTATATQPKPVDLESEAKAWLAARRK